MLIDFKFSNFLSFKNEVTLSLEAASISEYEADCVHEVSNLRLLKGAAIYGANGSGKSNVLKAFVFFHTLIQNSVSKDFSQLIVNLEPFRLDLTSSNEPTMFEGRCIEGGVIYRYGFKVTQNRILEEWLYRKRKTGREARLFHRNLDEIRLGNFKEGRGLQEKTRPDSLFFSVCTAFNGPIAKEVGRGFQSLLCISIVDPHLWSLTAWLCTADETHQFAFKKDLEKLLQESDLGATRLICEKTENGGRPGFPGPRKEESPDFAKANYDIRLAHPIFDEKGKPAGEVEFDMFENESEGTRKLFALGGQVILALRGGGLLLVDEFDSKMHPLLSKKLVQLFNSTKNKSGAQLVIATHDTNLLEKAGYRRDQIWFTEKRQDGSSDLYSLVEYKTDEDRKIRKDASFESDYIQGRYGGIPYLGHFEVWKEGVMKLNDLPTDV